MKYLLSTALAFCIGIAANAQTNFSGTWTLTDRQEVEGPQYSNGMSEKYIVTQTPDSLIVESYLGETRGRQAFPMNGDKVTTNSAASQRRYVRWISWSADKTTATLTITFSVPGQPDTLDFTRTEQWRLSADGKTLSVQKRSQETRSETWAMNGTFTKQ